MARTRALHAKIAHHGEVFPTRGRHTFFVAVLAALAAAAGTRFVAARAAMVQRAALASPDPRRLPGRGPTRSVAPATAAADSRLARAQSRRPFPGASVPAAGRRETEAPLRAGSPRTFAWLRPRTASSLSGAGRRAPVQRRWRAGVRRSRCPHRRRTARAAAVDHHAAAEAARAPWRAGARHGGRPASPSPTPTGTRRARCRTLQAAAVTCSCSGPAVLPLPVRRARLGRARVAPVGATARSSLLMPRLLQR